MNEEILAQAVLVEYNAFSRLYEAFDSVSKAYYGVMDDEEGRRRLLALMIQMGALHKKIEEIHELSGKPALSGLNEQF